MDYVLALPQAPLEKELYMKIPKGFEIDNKGDTTYHILKLHRNLYVKEQVVRVWYQNLAGNLKKQIEFTHSMVDECIL